VYIPVYNGAPYLAQTLEALLQQTVPFAEIIVVNDGSRDNSEIIARTYPVKVVSHNSNKGIALARNSGVQQCLHDFVASVDVDCVLDGKWLEECLSFFNDDAVVGVGGVLLEAGSSVLADEWRAINLVQHFGDGVKTVPYLSGSNTIYRKQALMDTGLYDGCFQLHHEDIDISRKLSQAGKKLIYTSKARAFHIKRDNWYSVMRSCWGFRHTTYPHTIMLLGKDLWCEIKHSISIFVKSLLGGRFRLLLLDSIYPFIQTYFCMKAYVLKTTNFK